MRDSAYRSVPSSRMPEFAVVGWPARTVSRPTSRRSRPGLREGVAAVDGSLPAKHEYHVVPNAGHFAFTMICPPALAKNNPEGCTDAPGFDRAAFHKEFNAAVLAFFRANLGGT